MATGRARILCLGNELVGDDGAGLRVGRVLRALALPPEIAVELRRSVGLDLLDLLDPEEELVVVDAARTGGPPGQVRSFPLAELDAVDGAPPCHGLGLAEVLALAARLGAGLPPRTTVVTIEAAALDRYGSALDPRVEEAIPRAVAAALTAASAPAASVAEGRHLAESRAGWAPTAEEIALEGSRHGRGS